MVGMVVLVGAIVRRLLEGAGVRALLLGIIVGESDTVLGASVGTLEGAADGNRLGALESLIFTGALVMTRCIVGLAVGLRIGAQDSFRRGGSVGSSVALVGRLVGAR